MNTSRQLSILVASDYLSDSTEVSEILRPRFPATHASANAQFHYDDFVKHRPDTLVLAFRDLANAKSYYANLHLSADLNDYVHHRTIVLVHKDQIREAFDLCSNEYFDDYVIYWPIAYDGLRLLTSVLQTFRQLHAQGQKDKAAMLVQRMERMKQVLNEYSAQGLQHSRAAREHLNRAEIESRQLAKKLSQKILAHQQAVAAGPDEANLARFIESEMDQNLHAHLRDAALSVSSVDEILQALPQQAEEGASPVTTAEVQSPPRRNILVVDDDLFQRKVLSIVLQDLGYDMAYAQNAQEAMESIRNACPDLILMDYSMPDVNGVQLTRKLRSVEGLRHVPIIMVTGNSDKNIVADSLSAGAHDFIVKPVKRDTLQKKIERLMDPLV